MLIVKKFGGQDLLAQLRRLVGIAHEARVGRDGRAVQAHRQHVAVAVVDRAALGVQHDVARASGIELRGVGGSVKDVKEEKLRNGDKSQQNREDHDRPEAVVIPLCARLSNVSARANARRGVIRRAPLARAGRPSSLITCHWN